MSFYIVADSLSSAINQKLDEKLAELPDEDRAIAEKDRDFLYGQLLDAFNKLGEIPEFTLAPNLPEFVISRKS